MPLSKNELRAHIRISFSHIDPYVAVLKTYYFFFIQFYLFHNLIGATNGFATVDIQEFSFHKMKKKMLKFQTQK